MEFRVPSSEFRVIPWLWSSRSLPGAMWWLGAAGFGSGDFLGVGGDFFFFLVNDAPAVGLKGPGDGVGFYVHVDDGPVVLVPAYFSDRGRSSQPGRRGVGSGRRGSIIKDEG